MNEIANVIFSRCRQHHTILLQSCDVVINVFVHLSDYLHQHHQVSQFGGSAWEWSEQRQQFYLHQFAVEQADFNFRHQPVRDEMINIMRFWLDEGADGFR